MLTKELATGKHEGITEKYITRLQTILLSIADSDDFRLTADIIREKAAVFDRLRDILRLDSEDGCISKTNEVEIDDAVLACMENNFNEYVKELEEELKHPSSENVKKAVEIILKHVKEHGEFLWGHKSTVITSKGEKAIQYIARTNNILECFFRPPKRNIRRRGGCGDIGYSLEHTKESVFYVDNLSSQEYLDCVYDGSIDNLPIKFALYDINHRKKCEVTEFPTINRGSLPPADKKIVRNKKYSKKII